MAIYDWAKDHWSMTTSCSERARNNQPIVLKQARVNSWPVQKSLPKH
jgi:hypothetical protein